MLKLGISSLALILDFIGRRKSRNFFDIFLDSIDTCLELAENEGVTVCELVIDFPILSSKGNKRKLIEICESYSLEKQIHGPFIDVNLCTHNDKISQASVDNYIESAFISEEIGAKILTIHPGIANTFINSINSYNMKRLVEAVEKILNVVKDLEVKVCIENMPKSCNILLKTEDFNEFFSLLNRDALSLTYDTSHHWTNVDDPTFFWQSFHNKIKNVHLVDNNKKDRDPHIALGNGKIDFDKLLSLIKTYKYEGPLIIELNSKKALINGIEFISQKLKNFNLDFC